MNLTLLNIKLKSIRRAASSPHSRSTCLSCHLQENRPKGTSVLQLAVTDRDASHNGPPFTFAIVDGNEGNAFHISQQGALVTVGALNRKSKEHYLLQAQVSHSTEERVELRGFIDFSVRPTWFICPPSFPSLYLLSAMPNSHCLLLCFSPS